ncbi:MAG: AAA family ATPase [Desulfobacterales bacterium]|nr:AAA family ATPase [Desulfobacterales bacterium]MBF0397815.1 AAA family ATPase [Desulfobacterales bacterium]
MKPFDPLATIIRHWFKIVVFGMPIFIMILPILMIKNTPYYSAFGKLRISPVVPALITRSDELSITGYYNSYVQTQVDKIKTPEIIETAAKKLPARFQSILIPNGIPLTRGAEIIRRRLIVVQMPGTHIITVTLGGTKPDGLAEMVNSVLEVYLEKLREEDEGRDNRRLMYLKQERDIRGKELERLSDIMHKLSSEASTSTFSEMHNLHDPALVTLQHSYVKAYEKRVEKENTLKELRKEIERLEKISLDPLVAEMVENNDALSQIDFFTYQMLQQMRSSIDGIAKDNPDKKYIDARMKGMKDYLEKMRENIRERSQSVIYGKRDVEHQQRLLKAEAEFRQAKLEEEEILKERNRLQLLKSSASQSLLKGQEIAAQLEHLRTMLNRIDERMNDLKLESMAPGRITLESRARKPEFPESDGSKKALIMAIALSFGVATASCIAFDILDKRIRTRKDITSAIGAQPSWPISNYLPHSISGVEFHYVTRLDPRNKVAMSLYTLAVHIDKERQDHNARIAVFTGVDSCSGVTGIAINTAYALSLMCSGILVIDANLLHPNISSLTGIKSEINVWDLLDRGKSIDDCISPVREHGFDILPLFLESHTSELGPIARISLIKAIKQLKTRYGFIVIDAPPILMHDITEYLLVHSDIAALIVQGDRSSYSSTYLAVDIILKLQVPALKPVLNWGAPRQRLRIEEIAASILKRLENLLLALPGRLAKLSLYIERIRGKI